MTRGRILPVVTIKPAGSENNLRDLLLGGSVSIAVEGLQHSAQARALLPRQPLVWWNGASMKRGEQAADRFYPVKSFQTEGNERNGRAASRPGLQVDELDSLAVAEVVQKRNISLGAEDEGVIDFW